MTDPDEHDEPRGIEYPADEPPPVEPSAAWWGREVVNYVGGGLVIGGTAQRLPQQYDDAVGRYLRRMQADDWQQWWSQSGQPPLELWNWVGGPKTEIRVRRTAKKVTATIDRAVDAPDPRHPADPGREAARDDVRALLAKLQSRFELPAPPRLPWEWEPAG